MLEESDQDEPVVHPQVRCEIKSEHLSKPARIRPVRKTSQPKEESDTRDQHLEELMGLEQWGTRDEVFDRHFSIADHEN